MHLQEEEGGKYKLKKEGVEFSKYMRDEGWHIIPIKATDQLVRRHVMPQSECLPAGTTSTVKTIRKPVTYSSASFMQMYGCNVLNLGHSRIISVNPASARRIVKDPHFKGDVQVPTSRRLTD